MSYCFNDLTQACGTDWQAYTQHSFVEQLAQGELAESAFRFYLQQDYLFLVQFTRAYALAVYKTRNLTDLKQALNGLRTIFDVEMQLHISYCQQWGIDQETLNALPEARATLAYTRYVLDAGARGNLLDLHVALAPCVVGYYQVSKYLAKYPKTLRGEQNPYEQWLQMYDSAEFHQAAEAEIAWLDQRLTGVSAERFNELATVFHDATRLEIDFWQAGLDAAN